MDITYYGHSCFLVQLGDTKLLFDPFITPNTLASEVNISSIIPDYILVSHAHEDHTADVEAIAKQSNATIIANWEIATHYGNKGFEHTHPMNFGGKWDFEFGTVKMVAAMHSSSFPDGTYGGNPAGFIIESAEHTFYYSGDTALFGDMKLFGEQQKIDFAFLPIGDNFTMDTTDAMVAANFIGVQKVIGMHYDTFPYVEVDHMEADMIARKNQKELILMEIGETIKI